MEAGQTACRDMAAAGAALGRVRAEALFTERGAWFVCFPGFSASDRLISVKQTEQALADTLLDVCRHLHARRPAVTKPELQAACRRAKTLLRSGAALAAVLAELLPPAEPGHSGAELCASPDEVCEAPAHALAADTEPDADMASDLGDPPLPPPDTPPPAADLLDGGGENSIRQGEPESRECMEPLATEPCAGGRVASMAAACVDVLSPPKPSTDEAPTGVAVAAVEFARTWRVR